MAREITPFVNSWDEAGSFPRIPLVHELAYRIEHRLAEPQQLVARIAMAKVMATQAMQFCADQAVQILGGMGFMRGTRSERIYREAKVMMIGGGSEEVLKDLAARQLGL